MTIAAGYCTACGQPIWRTVTHPRTGETLILYPDPTSVYARVGSEAGGTASAAYGIGYCAPDAPRIGEAGPALPGVLGATRIVGLDAAGARYGAWYAPRFGQHLTAWLADHLELADHDQAAVLAQWEKDRQLVEGPGG